MDAINNILSSVPLPLPLAGQGGTGESTPTAADFLSALEQAAAPESGTGGADRNEKIEQAASEFESVFLSLLLKEMRNTLDQENGGLFGGEGSDTLGGMFDMFMGKHLAEASPLGISDAVKSYLGNTP